jgi:alcohol dehydrogenase YqhD (iron-dependent ADH family)
MQSGIYTYPGTGRIVYGTDFAAAIADEVKRVGARRVYVLGSGTLESTTDAERQAWVSEALGRPGESAADVVSALIAELGLPQTLRDVGLPADKLDLIAENSMYDKLIHTNPRKIDGPATVRQLLDAAW